MAAWASPTCSGLHYWFKRIGFNRQVLGGPESARHDAAMAQGWIGN